jgi:hypothetical protein
MYNWVPKEIGLFLPHLWLLIPQKTLIHGAGSYYSYCMLLFNYSDVCLLMQHKEEKFATTTTATKIPPSSQIILLLLPLLLLLLLLQTLAGWNISKLKNIWKPAFVYYPESIVLSCVQTYELMTKPFSWCICILRKYLILILPKTFMSQYLASTIIHPFHNRWKNSHSHLK